ncbi:FecR domain-containing protein [Magnetococcales bacterium HHB-1]
MVKHLANQMSHLRKTFLILCMMMFLSWYPNTSLGQATPALHVGRVVVLKNGAKTRLGNNDFSTLSLHDKVYPKQQVVTEHGGKIVIRFRDGALATLGPNAQLNIDRFIFNPAENLSKKAVTLSQGAFRYVSGLTLKNSDMRIHTPLASLGLRGTTADVYANRDKSPAFVSVNNGTGILYNDEGNTPLNSGDNAVVDNGEKSAPTKNIPDTVAAKTIEHIKIRVDIPTEEVAKPTVAQQQEDAQANLVPAQTQAEENNKATAPPPAETAEGETVALLEKASEVKILGEAQPATETQQQFLQEAEQEVPNAEAQLQQHSEEVTALNQDVEAKGTKEVVESISQEADKGQLLQVVGNAIKGNPEATKEVVEGALANEANQNAEVAAELSTVALQSNPDSAKEIADTMMESLPESEQQEAAASFTASTAEIAPEQLTDVASTIIEANEESAGVITAVIITHDPDQANEVIEQVANNIGMDSEALHVEASQTDTAIIDAAIDNAQESVEQAKTVEQESEATPPDVGDDEQDLPPPPPPEETTTEETATEETATEEAAAEEDFLEEDTANNEEDTEIIEIITEEDKDTSPSNTNTTRYN